MTRPLLSALALALFLPLATPLPALADEPSRTISVQGMGAAYGKPDMASASAGIESRGKTPDEALAANTKTMNTILAAIKRHGITERDVETSNFSVNPVYAQQPGPRGLTAIEGYQVTNQVNVRVRDMDKLGGLLSSLVEAGANRLHGVSFDIAEPAKLQDDARKAAFADARKRADLYATAAGARVKRVLTISEGSIMAPPQPMMMRAMKAGAEAVPVAAGEQTVSASVSVTFEIE